MPYRELNIKADVKLGRFNVHFGMFCHFLKGSREEVLYPYYTISFTPFKKEVSFRTIHPAISQKTIASLIFFAIIVFTRHKILDFPYFLFLCKFDFFRYTRRISLDTYQEAMASVHPPGRH